MGWVALPNTMRHASNNHGCVHASPVSRTTGQGHQQAFSGSKWAVGMRVAGNCRFAIRNLLSVSLMRFHPLPSLGSTASVSRIVRVRSSASVRRYPRPPAASTTTLPANKPTRRCPVAFKGIADDPTGVRQRLCHLTIRGLLRAQVK